jgi:hypothetical protein
MTMGSLYYGTTDEAIEMNDRLLAHVKVVTSTKLRRDERFLLTWQHAPGTKPGRSSIWLQASIPLRFVFDSAEPESLDPAVLQQLSMDANSSGGLTLDLSEPIGIGRERIARVA